MSKTMNKLLKVMPAILLAVIVAMAVMIIPAFAEGEEDSAPAVTTSAVSETEAEAAPDNTDGFKALGVAIAIGLAAGGGGLAMGTAVGKSVEGISRQPEAEGKIRTTLMLGLVFIETAIIYALLCVILIIFVL